MDQHTETLIELNSKLERLLNGIDTLTLAQKAMSEDISKIKEAVYNPDEGLYARIRALEQWRDSTAKVQWVMISGLIMLAVKQIWEILIMNGAGG